jgi:hypothetical protein
VDVTVNKRSCVDWLNTLLETSSMTGGSDPYVADKAQKACRSVVAALGRDRCRPVSHKAAGWSRR